MTHRELSEGLNDLIFNLSLEYEREQMNQDKNNPNYIENYIKDPEIQKEMELLAENGKKEIIIMKNFKYPENIDIYRVYDKVKRKYGFKYFGPKLGITETLYAEW